MRSPGRHLVRLSIVLLLIGGVTTDCAWLKRMRNTPRKHWWEIWKPKAPKSDFFYPSATDVVPPEPPPVLGTGPAVGTETLPPVEPPAPPTTPGAELGVPATTKTRHEPQGMLNELQTVYFDFDSSQLKPETRRTLDDNARFLLAHPDIKVLIEGHCDERGTQEYNYNLGQRRADAVREYLISKGVPAEQLETISFGEDRPADPGHDEAAWAKNRRAQFMIY